MKWIQGSFAKRALMAGLIAGGGVLAASSFAMPAGGPENKPGCEVRQGQKPQAERGAFRAKHLAELKKKLKLKPGQEAAWNAFTRAAQPGMHRAGIDRSSMKAELAKLSTPERMDRMLAMSDMRRARMVERAEAIKAFYAQLSAEQQGIFDAEAMPKRRAGHRHHHNQLRHSS